MRLPQPLLDSPFFIFTSVDEFKKAMDETTSAEELAEILRVHELGLPPVSSRSALATMFGVNPGLIWSFEKNSRHFYRTFTIPKGSQGGMRRIDAPRVALKIVQKWLSVQLERKFTPASHVYGFVKGRSHVDAAIVHCNSHWIFSADIVDFFQSTPISAVAGALCDLGYGQDGAILLGNISCLDGALAQGAPSSPVLSNLCFQNIDISLLEIATHYGVRLTRYADDIVFSGARRIST